MGRIIPYIMEHKKCLKPPTRLKIGEMGLQVSIHGWIAIFPFHSWELSIMVGMLGFPTTIPNHIHCGAPPIVGWFINPTNYSYIPLKPVLTKLYILIYLAKALEPNHSMINTVIWLLSVNIDINELIPNIICIYIYIIIYIIYIPIGYIICYLMLFVCLLIPHVYWFGCPSASQLRTPGACVSKMHFRDGFNLLVHLAQLAWKWASNHG